MQYLHIKNKFEHLVKQHALRKRHIIAERDANIFKIDAKNFTQFLSNDYLALSTHPKIKKAFINGIQNYGVGSSASALVSGYFKPHAALEDAFATFLNRDKALLFNSGYHANLGIMTSLADRKSLIAADKYIHASIIDGIQLSRAHHVRYRHQDTAHAEFLIKDKQNNKLLVTESIFSMQGTIAPVKTLANIALKHQTLLIIDDAHGFGVLGKNGKGIIEYAKLTQQESPCLVIPFGKALGSMGAIVTGDASLIDTLTQSARTYCYSTALPPALCEATRAALKVIEDESWRREKLIDLIKFFIKAAKERNLPLVSDDLTPIKAIVIGSNQHTIDIQHQLMQQGFFVSCIRPPSVPKNTARIRISLNCLHKEEEIIQLLDLLTTHYEALNRGNAR
ncbi:MAG: 8-amino-7-oxononanoate synthase [Gammaproteobacteria bacterium RIFCSPHIGHO2_12_FULL_38_14]|nr:MAG: 8-amino-7-oxononanoate synthase [Gammaproteobacteria bacterium RIFCSPHIGHO2_12_FULL_38_14]